MEAFEDENAVDYYDEELEPEEDEENLEGLEDLDEV